MNLFGPHPKELAPWPYGPLPSVRDVRYGDTRYVVQRTEDGLYGFAFRANNLIATTGPHESLTICNHDLREAAPPNYFEP